MQSMGEVEPHAFREGSSGVCVRHFSMSASSLSTGLHDTPDTQKSHARHLHLWVSNDSQTTSLHSGKAVAVSGWQRSGPCRETGGHGAGSCE